MKHFKRSEFDCPCCGQNEMDNTFLDFLDKARVKAGVAFVVNSGFRCADHNKAVGGKPTSSHLVGMAADIEAKGAKNLWKIAAALMVVGFTRLGIGDGFIHVDMDPDKNARRMWTYYK